MGTQRGQRSGRAQTGSCSERETGAAPGRVHCARRSASRRTCSHGVRAARRCERRGARRRPSLARAAATEPRSCRAAPSRGAARRTRSRGAARADGLEGWIRLRMAVHTSALQGPAAFAQRANLRRPDTRAWDAVRTVTLSAGLQSDSTLNLRRPTLRTNLRLSGDAGLMRG